MARESVKSALGARETLAPTWASCSVWELAPTWASWLGWEFARTWVPFRSGEATGALSLAACGEMQPRCWPSQWAISTISGPMGTSCPLAG